MTTRMKHDSTVNSPYQHIPYHWTSTPVLLSFHGCISCQGFLYQFTVQICAFWSQNTARVSKDMWSPTSVGGGGGGNPIHALTLQWPHSQRWPPHCSGIWRISILGTVNLVTVCHRFKFCLRQIIKIAVCRCNAFAFSDSDSIIRREVLL